MSRGPKDEKRPGSYRKKAALNSRPIIVVIAATLLGSAQSAELERWICKGDYGDTIWTIADNRMFAAKGKGALQVAANSPSLTVAYILSKNDKNDVISYVYILDKQDRKLIVYNDMIAAIFKGTLGQPFEPKVSVSTCAPANADNSK